MIGRVVSQQRSPSEPVVSAKLKKIILEKWSRKRELIVPTLVEQDESWKEFWLYASQTKSWCPRMCAIQALFGEEGDGSEYGAETMWNFGQGNAYHGLFQNDMFMSLGGDILGSWERYLKITGEGLYKREFTDPESWLDSEAGRLFLSDNDGVGNILIERPWQERPDGDGWGYVEPKIRLRDHRVVVKIDAIIRIDGERYVVEIKTERSRARDSLDPMMGGGPRPYHVEQANIGMWATGIRKAIIVYVFKGEDTLSYSLLEHEISYDEEIICKLKGVALKCVDAVRLCDEVKLNNPNGDDIFEDNEDKNKWIDEHFPRLNECPMKSKGAAKYCAARDDCFPGRGKRKKK